MQRKSCVYRNLVKAMMIDGINITDLSEITGIEYKGLCKRMNGDVKLTIDEALLIYYALDGIIPMNKMFERG